MRPVLLTRTIAAIACVALVVALWQYWAAICNEGCAQGRALSMQLLSIALPASILFSVVTASAPLSSRLKRLIAALLVVALLLCGLYISVVP